MIMRSGYRRLMDGGTILTKISNAKRAELVETARAARENSYSPYSGFKVGAAILFGGGEVAAGCNVENSSFSLCICAERNAMASAVALGLRDPAAIAIVGEAGLPCAPCGACRQFLSEFNPQMEVILEDGGSISVFKLSELLPLMFSPKNLSDAR